MRLYGMALFFVGAVMAFNIKPQWEQYYEQPNTPIEVVQTTDAEYQQRLSPQAYAVLRKHATEKSFSGVYDKNTGVGTYVCGACAHPLFSSKTKFDSGTGWPSFWFPISANSISYVEDNFLFMKRTEVRCQRCDSHLGHVFNDGPAPTGLRYCINSVALIFKPKE